MAMASSLLREGESYPDLVDDLDDDEIPFGDDTHSADVTEFLKRVERETGLGREPGNEDDDAVQAEAAFWRIYRVVDKASTRDTKARDLDMAALSTIAWELHIDFEED